MTITPSSTERLHGQFGLAGDLVAVTDGGRGIGRAVALTLSSLGPIVIVLDNNLEAAKDTARVGDGLSGTRLYRDLALLASAQASASIGPGDRMTSWRSDACCGESHRLTPCTKGIE